MGCDGPFATYLAPFREAGGSLAMVEWLFIPMTRPYQTDLCGEFHTY
jgi:hypothetical protein